jgi:hypothetical protein
MADKAMQLKAVPAQEEKKRDPIDRQLGEETVAAMQKAMMTATVIITTVKGRKLNKSDVNDLAAAGLSGWDCAIFKIVGDESYSVELRGEAIKLWATRRSMIIEQARKMARALVG